MPRKGYRQSDEQKRRREATIAENGAEQFVHWASSLSQRERDAFNAEELIDGEAVNMQTILLALLTGYRNAVREGSNPHTDGRGHTVGHFFSEGQQMATNHPPTTEVHTHPHPAAGAPDGDFSDNHNHSHEHRNDNEHAHGADQHPSGVGAIAYDDGDDTGGADYSDGDGAMGAEINAQWPAQRKAIRNARTAGLDRRHS